MKTLKYSSLLLSSLVAIVLVGCGGGGGDNPSNSSQNSSANGTNSSGGSNSNSGNGGSTNPPLQKKIYVAESNETTEDTYTFYNQPLLYKGKVYTRLFRGHPSNTNIYFGMKIVEYDLGAFNKDMPLKNLQSKLLYQKELLSSNTNHNFSQRYYNLLRLGDSLYFSALPTNKNQPSQSGRIKYNLSSYTPDYEIYTSPVLGKRKDKTFDLTRGWFIPAYNNNYIAVIEEAESKVFEAATGEVYNYDGYAYLCEGENDALHTLYPIPAVVKNNNYYYASNKLYKAQILPNKSYVEYGRRDLLADPTFVEKDILSDFKTLYNGTKNYRIANYNGRGIDVPELIVDGNSIYMIARLGYDNSNNETLYDLYLLEYDLDSNLKNITLLDTSSKALSDIYAYVPYKYKDTIYFKVGKDDKHYLYAYNLTQKKYTFQFQIGSAKLDSYFVRDTYLTDYVITGDKIILPDYEESAKSNNNLFSYNVVFRILDINSGKVLETLKPTALQNLKWGTYDELVTIRSSLSDKNAVYFFATKNSDVKKYTHNLIIKIPHSNKIVKSQYRIDNSFSGVYK